MDIEDIQIKKIFDERDARNYASSAEKAYIECTTTKSRNPRNTRKAMREKMIIKNRIITIVLSGLLLVGGVKLTASTMDKDDNTVINETTYEYNMDDIGKKIGSLVYTHNEDTLNTDNPNISILSQCTIRNSTDTFGYNHTEIARKILSLDKELQEYALCDVLKDMGSYRSVEFQKGKTNGDYLLQMITLLESNNEDKLLDGVTSLNDYLKLKGYIKEDGTISFDKYTKAMNNNSPIINDIVDSLIESKGVTR